jgi:ABC-type nitrate/sulfonate/bicarbonate transport system permease component
MIKHGTGERTLAIRLVTLAIVALLWEGLAQSGLVFKDVVPSLGAIALAAAREVTALEFYRHLAVTLGEIGAGFVLGAVPGILLGLVLGSRWVLGAAADPYIAALATTPKIVFLPIIMLLVGIGPGLKIALGALSAFFPVVIATTAGMRAIAPVYVRVGRAFNLSPWQMAWKVYLPALVLPILAGLRLGLGVCIIGVVLGELKLSKEGLGFLANDYYGQFRIAELYALVAIIFVLAAAANLLMSRLSARAERF